MRVVTSVGIEADLYLWAKNNRVNVSQATETALRAMRARAEPEQDPDSAVRQWKEDRDRAIAEAVTASKAQAESSLEMEIRLALPAWEKRADLPDETNLEWSEGRARRARVSPAEFLAQLKIAAASGAGPSSSR